MKILVAGLGSWGIAIAGLLNKNGHKVSLWGRNSARVDNVRKNRKSDEYLTNYHIDEKIYVTDNLQEAADGAEMAVISVPSKSVRDIAKSLKPFLPESAIVVNTSKGIEENSLKLLDEVIEEELPKRKIAVLYGPSHAEEVALGLPTTCVASSKNSETARIIQDAFMAESFRVYTSSDLIGVEVGGALKNVISLAAGISDGMGFGDNAKAALMTRGIVEISRLGVAMGADEMTFSGLSGIGDLIVTCISNHSRNRRAGILLGQGKNLEETLAEIKMVVEGVNTTKAAYALSKKYDIEMPITSEIYATLFMGKNPKEAVYDLMTRDKTREQPHFVLL